MHSLHSKTWFTGRTTRLLRCLSVAAVLAVALGLSTTPAWACATCGSGDPTLTSMGTEQPFAGRLRLATSLRAWGLSEGDAGLDQVDTREVRMDLSASYAPSRWLFLSATLPLQARRVRDVSLAHESAGGPGDLEVSLKAFVYRDRDFAPDHLVSVLAGAKLPTAPWQRDAQGRALSLDAQLGSGSVDPLLGVGYATFQGDWSLFGSAIGYLPTRGHEGFRAGASLRTTLAAQYQPGTRLALQLAADTRLETVADTHGEPEPQGGGFIGFLSPDVLFSPTQDLVVQFGVRVPVLNLLRGRVKQTPILQASLAYDL
jgi:hypothetical protein